MLRFFGYVMCAGFLSLAWGARPATPAKKAPAKKTTTKTVARKSSASKSSSSKSSSSKAGSGNSSRRTTTASKKPASWRSRQAAPSPDRYKQIQEALAAKGYLAPEEATGSWGPNSVAALKRFQDEQKIDGAGKINSLSLIALGLGPKRENLATAKPPAPPPPGQ